MGSTVKYPNDLGAAPHEKYMLFKVSASRHIQRKGMIGEAGGADRPIHSVALYMPPEALTSTLNVDWGQSDMGIVGGKAIEAFTDPSTTNDTVIQKLTSALGAGLGATAVGFGAEKLKQGLDFVSSGGNGMGILDSALGQKLNPRTDMLFEAVKYRTHQFAFTLIPRNETEAKSIDEILSVFQFYMLPSFGTGGDESLFIGYPYEFTIDMYTTQTNPEWAGDYASAGPSQHINKIDRSVLTQCTIDHAAGQRVAFTGNYYPAMTTLQLNFTEVRLQGRDDQKVIWRGSKRPGDGANAYNDPNGPIAFSVKDAGDAAMDLGRGIGERLGILGSGEEDASG
jgi:hypothetical protein